ncbi:MAG: universal stress protein [archaeon]|nr:universal stress protein [archaeon]
MAASGSTKPGKIWLVAVDGSDNAKSAFHQATQLARETDEIHVLHVTLPLDASHFPPGALVIESMMSEMQKQQDAAAREMITYYDNKAKRLGLSGSSRYTSEVHSHSSPGEALCAKATRLRANYLVIGQRSEPQGTVTKLITKASRVSQYCIDNAPCHVLVIRASTERPAPGALSRQDTQEIRQASTLEAARAQTRGLISAESRRAAMKASIVDGPGTVPTLFETLSEFDRDDSRLEDSNN